MKNYKVDHWVSLVGIPEMIGLTRQEARNKFKELKDDTDLKKGEFLYFGKCITKGNHCYLVLEV